MQLFSLFLISMLTISFGTSFSEYFNWSRIIQGDSTLPESLKHINFPYTQGINKRIAGGVEAKPNSLPYQVGLIIQKNDNIIVWCSASLIWNNIVLTAAHCLHKAKEALLFFGAFDIRENNVKVKVTTTNFVIHPKYNPNTLFNDIALIKLSNDIVLNANIRIIDLPNGNPNNFEGYLAITSGWGKYKDDEKINSNILRFVEVIVMNLDDCIARYGSVVKSTNICIDGSQGKSTCSGDSGGPLATIEDTGRLILIGLTSFGSKLGCEKGWPSVFTRISSYLDWISKYIY